MSTTDLSSANRTTALLRSLPIAHRVGIGAALVVVALAGYAFLQWLSSPSYSLLASDLSASDLGEITAELESSGIPYQVENGGDRVMVPRADFAKARAALADAGVATDAATARDRGYELLDQQGFGLSANLERINVQRALEGELARSVRAMDGVDDAVVHLVMPEETLFGDPEAASASVIIDVGEGFRASGATAVANLVAGAVENLETSAITVIDMQGRILLAPDDQSSGVDMGTATSQTREFEKRLEEDITRLLLSAGAGDRSTVMVRATLDFDQVTRRTETYDAEGGVPLREQTQLEQFTGNSALAPGGVPGVDGEQLNPELDGAGGLTYEKNDRTTEFGVDNIITNEVLAAGALQELHVGVVIDDGSITGAGVPDADTVSNLISNAVGLDPARGDSIVVAAVPFPAIDETEPVALTAPAAAGGPSILDLIPQAVGALVLILVVAVVLLMLKNANKGAGEGTLDVPQLAAGMTSQRLDEGSELSLGAGAPVSSDARIQVRRLVEEQPEEIASLLRSWLADA